VSDVHLPGTVATARSWANQSAETVERALLAHISRGCRSALAQLYHLYFPRLASFVGHLTANAELAEELISDTMFDVWRKRERIDSNCSVFVWVMGIAYRHAHRRLAGRNSDPSGEQPTRSRKTHACPGPIPEEIVPRLQDLLLGLTFEERAVLYLVHSSHHSRLEVARIMNQSSEYVDMHLTNARFRLRSSANHDGDSIMRARS
jgi:RNA polymerase sigma-70 factor, ECF subfamily